MPSEEAKARQRLRCRDRYRQRFNIPNTKHCIVCNRDFPTRGRAKFCSAACKAERARNKRIAKWHAVHHTQSYPFQVPCIDCGALLIKHSAGKRFCEACVKAHAKIHKKTYERRRRATAPPKIFICKGCSVQFKRIHWARYCSEQCATIAQRQHQSLWRATNPELKRLSKKNWIAKNFKRYKQQKAASRKWKRANDPQYRAKTNLKSRQSRKRSNLKYKAAYEALKRLNIINKPSIPAQSSHAAENRRKALKRKIRKENDQEYRAKMNLKSRRTHKNNKLKHRIAYEALKHLNLLGEQQ